MPAAATATAQPKRRAATAPAASSPPAAKVRRRQRPQAPAAAVDEPTAEADDRDTDATIVGRQRDAARRQHAVVRAAAEDVDRERQSVREFRERLTAVERLVESANAAQRSLPSVLFDDGDGGNNSVDQAALTRALANVAEAKRARVSRDAVRAVEACLRVLSQVDDALTRCFGVVEALRDEVESHGDVMLTQMHACMRVLNQSRRLTAETPTRETRVYVYGMEPIDPRQSNEDTPFM